MGTKETFFYFPGQTGPNPCHVTLAGTSICDGSYRIERAKPTHAVLEYIVKGRGTLMVAGTEVHPEAGDVYCLVPGPSHRYSSSADDPWTKLWFNIDGPLVPLLLEAHGLAGTPLIRNCPAKSLFERGHRFAKAGGSSLDERFSRLFLEIIQLAARVHRDRHARCVPPTALRLKAWLDARWKEPLTLDGMASVTGLSRAQTVRLFRGAFGVPPYRYLLKRRIQHAQALLSGTTMAVREVARETGFDDEYHFAAIFKRHTGMSPGHWGRNHGLLGRAPRPGVEAIPALTPRGAAGNIK